MRALNPWFPKWPTDGGARENVVRTTSAPAPAPVRSVAEFLESGQLPPKFVQVFGWDAGTLGPGEVHQEVIRFDDDLPYRMDAIQARAAGRDDAAAWLGLSVELPSGRRLTHGFVMLATLCGEQGGKSFVYFRHRFPRSSTLVLTLRNFHPSAALSVSGDVVGFKLTGASRL